MALTVQLLARFQLSVDGTLFVPLGPRLQTLVAYVALHREAACSRRQVAAALWPETNDEQALKNLRTQIARLRQALPTSDGALAITPDTLRWRDDGDAELDVASFETAAQEAAARRHHAPDEAIALCEQALRHYTGNLLPDWYDDWLQTPREQLHAAYLATLELLCTLLGEQRRHAEAQSVAQRWQRADPLNEAAYAQLMRLHLRQGERSAALRVFQAAAAALREGSDAAPGPLLHDLLRQAQAWQEPGTAAPRSQAAAASPSLAPVPPEGAAQAREPLFVGRSHDLRWLDRVWEQCAAGTAIFAVVTGEAGIGKTRLVEEWLYPLVQAGVTVGTTRCYAGGEALAYAPLGELLRHPAFAAWLHQLEPIWKGEIARLLPELAAGDTGVTPPGPLTETWQRQRFFQALTRLVLGAAAQGEAGAAAHRQVLYIDDLQWCDGETLGWLAYLMHAASNSALLLLATLRSEDLQEHEALARFLLGLQRAEQYAVRTLGPLSQAHTAALAASVGGRPLSSSEARSLYQHTEGNPLFVVEMVRAWPPGAPLRTSPLPPRMQAVVRYRLSQLSAAARAAVQTAAVIGRDFNLPLLVRAGAQGEAEAANGLDELLQRQIVRPSARADFYMFGHDKLRQVAYEGIGAEKRRWLHGQVATALAAQAALTPLHAADPDGMAGPIAQHYAQSSRPEEALTYCLRAAGAAARMFANSEAVAFYQKAQALLGAGDRRTFGVLESLGELQRRQGHWQAAQQAYGGALALLDGSEVLHRAALLNKLGRTLIASHQRPQAWEALSSARTLLESSAFVRDETWYGGWIAVLMGLVEWHYWGGSTDEMARLVALLQEAVRQYGTRAQQLEWQQLAARTAFRRMRYVLSDEMVEERRAALEPIRQLGDPLEIASATFGYGFTLLWNGRGHEAGAQLRAALHGARQMGLVLLETQCLTYLAVIARLTGQIDEARNLTVLALESAQESQRQDYVGIARANQAWLAWRSGETAAAKELGATALDDWDEADTGIPFRWLALWPLVGAALRESRVESALVFARMMLQPDQQPPPPAIEERITGALAAWGAGHGAQARATLEAAAGQAATLGYL